MIWLSLGRWDSSHGAVFTSERLYLDGRWTPFVRVRLRFLRTTRETARARRESKS